jgi:transposase-like protein
VNETKRERARDLFEEGVSTEAIARRLEVKRAVVTQWKKEFKNCISCGVPLIKATGRCGFCEIELKEDE